MHPQARIGTALAAAAFVLTAAPALADETADPSPGPSPTETASATPTPTTPSTTKAPGDDEEPTQAPTQDAPAPVLYIALTLPQATLEPGDDVTATVHVYATQAVAPAAKLALSVTGGINLTPTCTLAAGVCNLGQVDAAGEFIPVRLSVPANAATGQVSLTTTASATGAAERTVVHLLRVADEPVASPSPSQTTTPTPTPSTSAPSPSATPSVSVPPVAPAPATSTTSAVPPYVPESTPDPSGGAAPGVLPEVASQAQPYTMTVSAIKPDPSADPLLTSLVRAQAAWLGVLFVLVGLLFARVRRTPATARGTHRRPGRGRFAR
ncbi:hypothetical protein [Actinocorallia sp. A-T 12471]|uniref:hypothetical protein n=1 Tax=Actinocorallia sp. A-T 12471 TaxID=3089813 RepID=UPI0029CF914D|nr:hypothetical protein [Actinocorallia sp. A-T 12471]MDX6742852.1 hypothetical protein [Actinocorallia sp. A-T 12471]